MAKKYHPDICDEPDAKQKFIAINEAYEILCDPDLANRVKSQLKRKKYAPNPSPSKQKKAANKASMKAKMSAEEFQKYRMKVFRKDKIRLVKMLLSPIGFAAVILLIVHSGNDPDSDNYREGLEVGVAFMLSIPIIIVLSYVIYLFITINADQKYFEKD